MNDHTSTASKDKCGNFDVFFNFTDEFWNEQVENNDDDDDIKIIGVYHPPKTNSIGKLTLSQLVHIDLDEILPFLSKSNPFFERKMSTILPRTRHLEQFRSIGLFMYKLLCLEMVHALWITYQKSGQGELTTKFSMVGFVNRKVWPQEVYSFLQLEQVKTIEEEQLCLNLIQNCLCQLDEKSEAYRRELRASTSGLSVYTPQVEESIEKVVQEELITLRIEFDYQMALVQYTYTDELLRRAYLTQHPTDMQIQWLERLCQLKYELELTRHEFQLLKDKIPVHLSAHPFDSQAIVQQPFVNQMSKPTLQQQLYFQYKNILQQVKMNQLNAYLSSLEEQIAHYHQQFQQEMNGIEKINRSLPKSQQLSGIMRNLIDERLANITARIAYGYKLKEELFHLKSMSCV